MFVVPLDMFVHEVGVKGLGVEEGSDKLVVLLFSVDELVSNYAAEASEEAE